MLATFSKFSPQHGQDFTKRLSDITFCISDLLDPMDVGELLGSILFQYDRLGKAESSLEEAGFVYDILACSNSAVLHFIFGSHNQDCKRTCLKHFLNHISYGMASP